MFFLVTWYICQFIACKNYELFSRGCPYCMQTLDITMQSSDFHQSGSLHDPIDNSCVRFSLCRSSPSVSHIFIQGEGKRLLRQLMFPNSYLCLPLTGQALRAIAAISTSTQEKGGIVPPCVCMPTPGLSNYITTSVERWEEQNSNPDSPSKGQKNSSLHISHLKARLRKLARG